MQCSFTTVIKDGLPRGSHYYPTPQPARSSLHKNETHPKSKNRVREKRVFMRFTRTIHAVHVIKMLISKLINSNYAFITEGYMRTVMGHTFWYKNCKKEVSRLPRDVRVHLSVRTV